VVSLVQALIVIASRVLEWQMAFAIMVGQLESAVLMLIVTPASYVVSFQGKERDRGNGIVV
jgi:multidrug efflux pump subunit AcrB